MTTANPTPAPEKAHTPLPHPDGKKPAYAFDTPCFTPFAAYPGAGWRFLEHGERIEYGDMTATTEGTFNNPVWIPCAASVDRIVASTQQFRRKALVVREKMEDFPLALDTQNRDELDRGSKRPAWETIVLRDWRDITIARVNQAAPHAEEYAAYIVTACNAYPALVERERRLREALDRIIGLYVAGYLKPESDGAARFDHALKQAREALKETT